MRLLVQSSRRFFYRHPGQLLLALVGIAAGVAVVTGVALMRDVLINALDLAGEELAGRDSVRVHHPSGRIDESLLADLATRPGAPELVPAIAARARHDGRILELLATDPIAVGGETGMGLDGNQINALMRNRAGVAMNEATARRLAKSEGDHIDLRIAGANHQLELTAILARGRALDDRLLMDIGSAQEVLGRQGELSWIEAPAGSRAWLEAELPEGVRIESAGERRDAAARLTEGMRANLTAMSLLSLAVGLFVIYSVLSFLLVQRRRAVGMLRAVGVTRGQITGLLATETFILAGLGALIGLVLGTVLADQLLTLVRQPIAELYRLVPAAQTRPTVTLYLAIWALAVALALGSTLAVWLEARRIPPGQLVRQDRDPTGTRPGLYAAATGLLITGMAVTLLSAGLAAALGGLFLALMGCALLAPRAGMLLLRLMRWPLKHKLAGRALGMLATSRRRIAPALAALSMALALSAGIGMMVLGFRVTVDDWIERLLRAEAYVTVSQGVIDAELTERIGELEGIAAVSSARQHHLPDGRVLIAYDLPADAWDGFELVAGDPGPAREAFMAGEAVLVTEPFARRQDKTIGDEIVIESGDHRHSLPIAAVYRDYGSDQGAIAVNADDYRDWFDDEVRDSLGLYFHETGDIERWRQRLEAIDERIVVTTPEQVRAQTLVVFDRTFRISWALAALVGIIALIALVSALLALGLERRRDHATLRALGLTRRGLTGLVVSQTTGLAAASALVAAPLAIAIHAGLTLVVQPRAFGWSLPLSLPLPPLGAMLMLALAAGLIAGLYPAWQIASRNPSSELRSRG
ncbi:ABC transporter permease [Wenzhouxiangella sp. AB-CW3]|uniref:FtsX-like permease family protein n=1 Tax=Wenzhouxiangella sp. AB-CW3 TaxID=2771012 RepID=UPI00168ABE8E|nr:ABC transporter permease [Wenzhouxiangella sp. AB-CW3]QOC23148.1 ABC transporter permease [Wenzhouxiangella sp. AB-CW3]